MKRITHRPRHTKTMTHYHTHHHLLLLAILYTFLFLQPISSSSSSPPDKSCPAVSDVSCGATSDGDLPPPPRNEVYGNGRIIDITHRYVNDMPSYGSTDGIGQFVKLASSIKNGSSSNGSEMKLIVHHGTHVDAPGHFYDHYYDAGYDIDTLDLDVLNGPALLIDVPRNSNITAEVMESLKIPKGVRRVLFRTANTDEKLMLKKEFDSSFTGFVEDGAKWLVENTDIKLVGLDYLSVAAHTDAAPVHHVFLKSREIILVEGLKLDNVKAGLYQMSCLPLRLFGAEASPARCILVK